MSNKVYTFRFHVEKEKQAPRAGDILWRAMAAVGESFGVGFYHNFGAAIAHHISDSLQQVRAARQRRQQEQHFQQPEQQGYQPSLPDRFEARGALLYAVRVDVCAPPDVLVAVAEPQHYPGIPPHAIWVPVQGFADLLLRGLKAGMVPVPPRPQGAAPSEELPERLEVRGGALHGIWKDGHTAVVARAAGLGSESWWSGVGPQGSEILDLCRQAKMPIPPAPSPFAAQEEMPEKLEVYGITLCAVYADSRRLVALAQGQPATWQGTSPWGIALLKRCEEAGMAIPMPPAPAAVDPAQGPPPQQEPAAKAA